MEARQEFDLSDEDQGFLEALGLPWETIKERGQLWVLIHNYEPPLGYAQKVVSIAINIPSSYPRAQLDMVYFYPSISRKDGYRIGALTNLVMDNKTWQRWSRHRTRNNPWREDVDNISTHFALIENWLQREFNKIPYEVPA
ncbi:E2/UBC family protein [Ulvibacterium sp.]|uniref:E2/UBC family protein n=1 Tax=Ulvibacterium sp. TaxID=2665914 RepID=UPI002615BF25|nr:E2/UBC family protein [Ulvibacterium sp.]